jgi:beta-lactamase regulating signal transducer with metallopeptidase domain
MMIAGSASSLLIAQADSARAISAVYTVSVLATLPLIVAAAAVFALRRAGAETRMLVWRSACIALLLAFAGRIPTHAVAWVVPYALSAPLVLLGRVQVTAASLPSLSVSHDALAGEWPAIVVVRLALAVYAAGVACVLLPTIVSLLRCRAIARRGIRSPALPALAAELDDARATVGVRRAVRVVVSRRAIVPATWGLARPVVVLPAAALDWTPAERRIALLHELTHVRSGDWAMNLAARLMCAAYWFHPGAWWIARGMREDCERACDDRVIAAGVRRSDYAELLVTAAEALCGAPAAPAATAALALSQRRGLRGRLQALLDDRHDVRPPARAWTLAAAAATVALATAMSTVRLAPSRDVLTVLMTDARWESRAYAVLGLAQSRDTVAVARHAAEVDPSPRVRAWARYALGESALGQSAVGERALLPDLHAISRD